MDRVDKNSFVLGAAIVAGGLAIYNTMKYNATTKKRRDEYKPNVKVAEEIAAVTAYYPFKGIDRFYDIGGFLQDPEMFAKVIDVLVDRYKDVEFDSIGGFDARGFIMGPPLALALKKPFFMLRKKGKMPNAVHGRKYKKEYASAADDDVLCIQRGAVKEGERVLLIDDLVATGGTLIAGIELVKLFGGKIVECACIVEIKALKARDKFIEQGHGDIPVWALLSEEILHLKGKLDKDYVDDGQAH